MQEFIAYLDRRAEEGRAEIEKLNAEGCRDDASLAKVRTNIYGVCATVSRALMNRPGAGTGAVRAQLERFRAEWGAALEKAKQHGDTGAAAVEEIKLDALEDALARFREVPEA